VFFFSIPEPRAIREIEAEASESENGGGGVRIGRSARNHLSPKTKNTPPRTQAVAIAAVAMH